MVLIASGILNNNFPISGPREQLNQITSYLDASFIYGSTKDQSDKLRDLSNKGILSVYHISWHTMLLGRWRVDNKKVLRLSKNSCLLGFSKWSSLIGDLVACSSHRIVLWFVISCTLHKIII